MPLGPPVISWRATRYECRFPDGLHGMVWLMPATECQWHWHVTRAVDYPHGAAVTKGVAFTYEDAMNAARAAAERAPQRPHLRLVKCKA